MPVRAAIILHSETFVNRLADLQPENVLVFALTGNENEAHFICAVLNLALSPQQLQDMVVINQNPDVIKAW